MTKAVGAPIAIAVVIFGASIMRAAGRSCSDRPHSSRPPRVGVYTAASGRVAAAALGAPGRRRCGGLDSGDHEDVHARAASGCKGNDGLVSRGSSRDSARRRSVRETGRAPVHAVSPPGRLRATGERSDQRPITPPTSCSRCRTSETDCGRAPTRGRRTPTT